ncbi:hypothetical protein CRE_24998 [Caenorhabditis remanei]|uniref:Uncharacterized protein n=1 Tax=Caenorhabditis remanei TaxID=31234 RepID=E3MHT5_CAERE|nr:hypothetical protein CRE_24998 [Caenorhabditis remanei]
MKKADKKFDEFDDDEENPLAKLPVVKRPKAPIQKNIVVLKRHGCKTEQAHVTVSKPRRLKTVRQKLFWSQDVTILKCPKNMYWFQKVLPLDVSKPGHLETKKGAVKWFICCDELEDLMEYDKPLVAVHLNSAGPSHVDVPRGESLSIRG